MGGIIPPISAKPLAELLPVWNKAQRVVAPAVLCPDSSSVAPLTVHHGKAVRPWAVSLLDYVTKKFSFSDCGLSAEMVDF